MGRIFKSVGLRWLPTGKLFDSCTSTVESEPTHGSNVDNSKIHECKQTLDLSAGTSIMFRRNKVLIFTNDKTAMTFEQNGSSLVTQCHQKGFYTKRPLLEHLNKTALSKDETVLLLRDGENLDKMKEKGDECIFVGYSNLSRAYRVFNNRTRVIMESIHVNFDELPQMASDQNSSDPAPEYYGFHFDKMHMYCDSKAAIAISCNPVQHSYTKHIDVRYHFIKEKVEKVTTSNELDLLFSPMFDKLLNGSFKVMSKSFVVSAADAPNQRQQYTTPLNIHITPAPTCQVPTPEPTFISSENINQAETYAKNNQVADDEFINIFSTPVQDEGETSSVYVHAHHESN
nr:integrase, catalytic region, zinc finger, CCHC-type, peptidase aspartic, catalytic [Tanacetum cinerariifolium]